MCDKIVYKCIQCGSLHDDSELVTMPRENAPGQMVWMETACPDCGGMCVPEKDYLATTSADELLTMRMKDIEMTPDKDVIKMLPYGCTDCQFVDALVGKDGVTLTCRHPKAATVCTEELTWESFEDVDTNSEIIFDCPLDEHFERAETD